MLSCEQILQELWQYLDRDLTHEELASVKEHLDLCRSCFTRVEFEKCLREEMKKKTNHCCPEQVKDRIKNLLNLY